MKQLQLGKFPEFPENVEPKQGLQGLTVSPQCVWLKGTGDTAPGCRISSAAMGVFSLTAEEGDSTQCNDDLK